MALVMAEVVAERSRACVLCQLWRNKISLEHQTGNTADWATGEPVPGLPQKIF